MANMDGANLELLTSIINGKIAGYEKGLALLQATSKGIYTQEIIELTEVMLNDLQELRVVAQLYDNALNSLIDDLTKSVDK